MRVLKGLAALAAALGAYVTVAATAAPMGMPSVHYGAPPHAGAPGWAGRGAGWGYRGGARCGIMFPCNGSAWRGRWGGAWGPRYAYGNGWGWRRGYGWGGGWGGWGWGWGGGFFPTYYAGGPGPSTCYNYQQLYDRYGAYVGWGYVNVCN